MKSYLLMFFLILSISVNAQWTQSGLNPGLGRSLYTDGTTIYAATNQGVYYTNDIGDPWFSIGPQNEDIYAIVKTGNKIIAGSGLGHGIYLSTNNGQDWYQPPTLSNYNINALAKSTTHIFAATWTGGIFKSTDDGESWVNAGLSDKAFWDLLVVDNILFAASPDLYSRIYYTADNGDTWNYGSLGYPASDPRGLYYSDGKLFACDAGLWVSTDMGVNWDLQYGVTFDSTGYPTDVMMFKSITKYNQFLVASVMFESIYTSTDNGVSWNPFNEGIISDWTFTDVEINGPYIWALRDFFGNAYRRPVSDLITNVEDKGNIIDDFKLKQNYPNPFNPNTRIKYQIPNAGLVILKVYDILGKEVSKLVDEYKPAGNYEVEFDASSLPSGVYFYRLRAGDPSSGTGQSFVETKKMVLMK